MYLFSCFCMRKCLVSGDYSGFLMLEMTIIRSQATCGLTGSSAGLRVMALGLGMRIIILRKLSQDVLSLDSKGTRGLSQLGLGLRRCRQADLLSQKSWTLLTRWAIGQQVQQFYTLYIQFSSQISTDRHYSDSWQILACSVIIMLRGVWQQVRNRLLRPIWQQTSTPVGRITILNTFLYVAWNSDWGSNEFLMRNFAFDKDNLERGRLHTTVTYAFSHLSTLHFAVNVIALQFMGRRVQKIGPKYVWLCYLGGALGGAVAMHYLMPYDTIPVPKAGADPSISAFLSFLAMQSPRLTIFTLFVRVKFWFVLCGAALLMLATDSSCKTLGGLGAGAVLGLMRRKMLI